MNLRNKSVMRRVRKVMLQEMENGTTAEALADRFGVSPSYVRKIVKPFQRFGKRTHET